MLPKLKQLSSVNICLKNIAEIKGYRLQKFIFAAPDDPRKVIVKKLALCVPDRADMELDLTGDLSKLKKQVPALLKLCHT